MNETLTIEQYKAEIRGVKPLRKHGVKAKVTPGIGGPTVVVVMLPKPPRATHQNARYHHRVKALATKLQREQGFIAAKEAMGTDKGFPWETAIIDVTYYTTGTPDIANLIGWLKASCDGFQDAGLIINDSGFSWGEVKIERLTKRGAMQSRFKLEIRRLS